MNDMEFEKVRKFVVQDLEQMVASLSDDKKNVEIEDGMTLPQMLDNVKRKTPAGIKLVQKWLDEI